MFHFCKIHATYLDDWGYISGRFALRIIAIVMVGLKIIGILDELKWHALAWKGMLLYISIQNINRTAL